MSIRKNLYETGANLFKIPNKKTMIQFLKLLKDLDKKNADICCSTLKLVQIDSKEEVTKLIDPLAGAIGSNSRSRESFMKQLTSCIVNSKEQDREEVFEILNKLAEKNYIDLAHLEKKAVDILSNRQTVDDLARVLSDTKRKSVQQFKNKLYGLFNKSECTGDSLKLLSSLCMLSDSIEDEDSVKNFIQTWNSTIGSCSDFDIEFCIASIKGEELPKPKTVETGKSDTTFGGVETVHKKQKQLAKHSNPEKIGTNTEMSIFMKDLSDYFRTYRSLPASKTVELLSKIENLSDFNKSRVGEMLMIFKEMVDEEIRIGND